MCRHWQRSRPRADIHQVELKTRRFTNSPRIRFDLEKLKDPKLANVFQVRVGGKFAALCVLDIEADTLANSLKEELLSIAEGVLGRQRRRFNLGSQTRLLICATRDDS